MKIQNRTPYRNGRCFIPDDTLITWPYYRRSKHRFINGMIHLLPLEEQNELFDAMDRCLQLCEDCNICNELM